MPPVVPREVRNHQLTIRMPLRVRRLLDRQAKRDQQSVADVVNKIIVQHYAAKARV